MAVAMMICNQHLNEIYPPSDHGPLHESFDMQAMMAGNNYYNTIHKIRMEAKDTRHFGQKRLRFQDAKKNKIIYYDDGLNEMERKNLWQHSKDYVVNIRNEVKRTLAILLKQKQEKLERNDEIHGVCLRGIEKFTNRTATARDRTERQVLVRSILRLQKQNKMMAFGADDLDAKLSQTSIELSKLSQLRAENRAYQDQEDAKRIYEEDEENEGMELLFDSSFLPSVETEKKRKTASPHESQSSSTRQQKRARFT